MYLTAKKHPAGSGIAHALANYVDTLEQYGLSIPANVRKAVDTSTGNLARMRGMRQSTDPASAAALISQKLAHGEGDALEVLTAASTRNLIDNNPSSPYQTIYANAERIVGVELRDVLAEHGDKWVTETMRPHVEKHAKTIIDAIPDTLVVEQNVGTKQMEFLLHFSEVANAWASLQGIYKTAREFRSVEIIPSTFQRDDVYEYAGSNEVRDYLTPGDITAFWWGYQHGLNPGLLTEKETSK